MQALIKTYYNEDGSLFEQIGLNSDKVIDVQSRRIIFDPSKDFVLGSSYYVTFTSGTFSDATAITDDSTWTFTCGLELEEKLIYSSAISGNHRLFIGLPDNYNTADTAKKYPVVYITDGGFFVAYVLITYREDQNFPFKNLFSVAQLYDFDTEEEAMAAAISDLPLNFYLAIGSLDNSDRITAYNTMVSNLESRSYPSFGFKHSICFISISIKLRAIYPCFPTSHAIVHYQGILCFRHPIRLRYTLWQ